MYAFIAITGQKAASSEGNDRTCIGGKAVCAFVARVRFGIKIGSKAIVIPVEVKKGGACKAASSETRAPDEKANRKSALYVT
jgi:hypothetical protein